MSVAALEAVYRTWHALDGHIEALQLPTGIAPEQGINDCAYVVMMFAQVEEANNSAFEELVGQWPGTPFLQRLELLEGDLSPPLIEELALHYELRCEVAHGRFLGNPHVHVADVADACFEAMRALEA